MTKKFELETPQKIVLAVIALSVLIDIPVLYFVIPGNVFLIVAPLVMIGTLGLCWLIHAAFQRELRRLEALDQFAAAHGFEFFRKPANFRQDYDRGFKLFAHSATGAKALMLKKAGEATLAVLEYTYTTGSGDSSSTHTQTVGYFASPTVALPKFTLEPETVAHRLFKFVVGEDIDFDDFPAFSDKYFLKGEDEQAIRALFTPDRIRFFGQQGNISIESSGDALIYWRASTRVDPKDMQTFIEEFAQITGHVAT